LKRRRDDVKILFLNPTGTLGGAERCLLDLLASLRSERPDWRLGVGLGNDGPLRPALEALGVPATVLPLPRQVARLGDAGLGLGQRQAWGGAARLNLITRGPAAAIATGNYLTRLRRWIRDEAPDTIQTNGMKAHLLGTWAAPRHVPIVWHLHDYLGLRPVMGLLLRWTSRAGVSAVAVSDSVAEDAARVLGPKVPVRPIYNAVDLDHFQPGPGDGARLDEAAGLPPAPPETVRVGLVATFARWKGHDIFLNAVARVDPSLPCRFYVVGGPIYQSVGSQWSLEELRTRASALGLDGRLGFVGHQDDPASVFRALDVVVHASTRPEPFGRVITEAMACGRAVIATPHGGAAELFEPEVSALSCPPGDADVLAAAITRLAADGELRQRLGVSGRRTASDRFDRSRLAEEWSSVYASPPCHEPGSRSTVTVP
jgi:glycosyltransferase involved in cell wall biosynthesis